MRLFISRILQALFGYSIVVITNPNTQQRIGLGLASVKGLEGG